MHAFPPDVETALLAALSVKQGWYEHPQEYLVRILVTVEQCDKYGLDISSLLLMLFLNGLCDHIKHRAMNRLPGSLVDAVKHADYNGHMYRWQVPEAAERAGATASGDMQYEDADLRSFKCSKPLEEAQEQPSLLQRRQVCPCKLLYPSTSSQDS